MLGDVSFVMVGLWFAGAFVLGAAILYGIMRAGRLRQSERARLDQNTARTQRAEDPHKRPF